MSRDLPRQKEERRVALAGNGILYVVATPIGNLEDITLRALRILKEVDLIAAEDTRHSRKLLSHYDIHTPLLSYYKDREAERSELLLQYLREGQKIALISDAGTPAISDPGAVLVLRALAQAIPVEPIPGPSALTATLSVAGLAGTAFLFLGFLPSQSGARRKALAAQAGVEASLVFYESPLRVVKSLRDCLELLGDRRVFLARELTKIHEEKLSAPLSQVLAKLAARPTIKGEFVVVVEGAGAAEAPPAAEIEARLAWYRDQSGLSLRDAVARLAKELGLSRSELYQTALRVWEVEG